MQKIRTGLLKVYFQALFNVNIEPHTRILNTFNQHSANKVQKVRTIDIISP